LPLSYNLGILSDVCPVGSPESNIPLAEAQDLESQSPEAQNLRAHSLDRSYPGLVRTMEALPVVSFREKRSSGLLESIV